MINVTIVCGDVPLNASEVGPIVGRFRLLKETPTGFATTAFEPVRHYRRSSRYSGANTWIPAVIAVVTHFRRVRLRLSAPLPELTVAQFDSVSP